MKIQRRAEVKFPDPRVRGIFGVLFLLDPRTGEFNPKGYRPAIKLFL